MMEKSSSLSPVQNSGNRQLSEFQIHIRTLLSGGLAGCTAKTIVAPFDRFRNFHILGRITGVFKALCMLFNRDGLFGIYRGHSAMLLRIFPYAGMNFFAYEYLKKAISADVFNPALHKLLCGSLAGAVSVSFTYPLDMLRAQLAYQTAQDFPLYSTTPLKRGLLSRIAFGTSSLPPIGSIWSRTLSSIFHSKEKELFYLKRLYRGYTASLCGIIPYAGVSFCTFETLKHLFITSEKENVLLKFLCGLMAGVSGQTAAYPFDVVRRQMQLNSIAPHLPHYHSPFEALSSILRQSGLKGLYVGISINYLKVSPATAISFVTYEHLKKHFGIM